MKAARIGAVTKEEKEEPGSGIVRVQPWLCYRCNIIYPAEVEQCRECGMKR